MKRLLCPNRSINMKDCTCTYPSCPRKGVCCICIAHHREKGEIPGCLFPVDAERVYNRTVKHFIAAVGKK